MAMFNIAPLSIQLSFIKFCKLAVRSHGSEALCSPDSDELLSIPASVRPLRIVNFLLTQFYTLDQMCCDAEGDELQSGNFHILLTVHPNTMTVYFTNLKQEFFILIHLLYSSTCFEHYYAHLQEENCISTASGIVTVFR